MEPTRSELMQASALSELQRTAEIFSAMLEKFQVKYPQAWKEINQNLYAQVELNLADLVSLLQIFSEISK